MRWEMDGEGSGKQVSRMNMEREAEKDTQREAERETEREAEMKQRCRRDEGER